MNVCVNKWNHKLPTNFEERLISTTLNRKGIFGTFELDNTNKYYPQRSDTKIMRSEVIASIICIGEMLEQMDFSESALEKMALYVANGCFLEEQNKHINKLFQTLSKIQALETREEKVAQMYRSIPPLSALETLTNSTMSFIAQYSKVKGSNSTIGNTSYSSFEVLKEAVQKVKFNQSNNALVGGANGSGIFSSLNYIGFEESKDPWKESRCCAYVLLNNNVETASAVISSYKNDVRVPKLTQRSRMRNWQQFFLDDQEIDYIVYSGGFTQSEFDLNHEEVSKLAPAHFSYNQQYGNTGAAAMVLNLIHGSTMIQEKGYRSVALLDRDPYGRETFIHLKKVED